MYLCSNCGTHFEEPKETIEVHHEVPPPNIEVFYDCPKCGSGNYDEIVECLYCNEDIKEELKSLYVKFANGDVVCNNCLHDYCVDKFS